jgi:toxin ParE1/3/4
MDYPNLESHPEADQEIEAAFDWYAERSVNAAENFMGELGHAVDQIMATPERWANYMFGTRRYIMKRYPFILVYRLKDRQTIQIIAVAHGHRNPGYWQHRVDD